MIDCELLLSLHQKVDRNHKWVKRQFGALLRDMTVTHNVVRKNHYYLHEVFDRTWATLEHLYTPEELAEMEFQRDFDWSIPPKEKSKKVQVPQLVTSSFSSSRKTDEAEDIDDTIAGPAPPTNPDNAGAPPPPSR